MNIAAKFLAVQNELNLKLSPEWATKGWAYPDAMFTEATEAYNHLNWEWWRATDRKIDWDQVKLEWVDVAHFLFSEVIATDQSRYFPEVYKDYTTWAPTPADEIDVDEIKDSIKVFIRCVLTYNFDRTKLAFEDVLDTFFPVIFSLGMDLEQFYALFIGKVCLNQLRWKNGYKKGIYHPEGNSPREYYVKTWNGVEDNVWLAEYAATLDPNDAEFKSKLETALDAKYKEVYEALWNINVV